MSRIKGFYSKLSKGQQVTIIAAIIGGCCLIVAAFVGLGVPILNYLLDRSVAQSALATPTFLPPTGSVELPSK